LPTIAGSIFKRWEGRHGTVRVPAIGLEIGKMEYWLITRREDTPSGVEEWDLRAAFSYINEFAFSKRAHDRVILITLGDPKRGGKQYRLQEGNGRTVLDARNLLIERVQLCQVEEKHN
jgi:hypothetical protein